MLALGQEGLCAWEKHNLWRRMYGFDSYPVFGVLPRHLFFSASLTRAVVPVALTACRKGPEVDASTLKKAVMDKRSPGVYFPSLSLLLLLLLLPLLGFTPLRRRQPRCGARAVSNRLYPLPPPLKRSAGRQFAPLPLAPPSIA